MDFREQRLDCEQARQIGLVDYLSELGYEPVKKQGFSYWYISPFRNEKTASFKVNRKLNRWYDFGMGKGGNLVDFGILFFDCTVSELLQKLQNSPPAYIYSFRSIPSIRKEEVSDKIHILNTSELHSLFLLRYLNERKIDLKIAGSYCQEITYGFRDKKYTAIGFKNDSGGYELRSPFFKGSSSPKGSTSFHNGQDTICVFEGFSDFLSYLVIYGKEVFFSHDFLILNSLSFFEKSTALMGAYREVLLYLDLDEAGQNCSAKASQKDKKYIDKGSLYEGHKDLNDYLVYHIPKTDNGIHGR